MQKLLVPHFHPMHLTKRSWSGLWARAGALHRTVTFVCCWALLNTVVNVRYPAEEPAYWYLIPSVDVTVLLAGYSVLGLLRVRIPRAVHVLITVLLVGVRLFRLGDGIAVRFQGRDANMFVDYPLVPELARLMYQTVPFLKLSLIALGTLVVLPVMGLFIYRASTFSARYLFKRYQAVVFLTLVAFTAAASPLRPPVSHPDRFSGAFAASVTPRLLGDMDAAFGLHSFRAKMMSRIEATKKRLEETSGDLAKLDHQNVLLITVESYGETVISREDHARQMLPAYRQFEAELRPEGFFFASKLLESSTFGGFSWMAHTTIGTGVRTTDQAEHQFVHEQMPRTIVHAFRDAGYRTTAIQPATMRLPKGPHTFPYDAKYYNWNFGYEGPAFSWAPMTDQFVMDFTRRNVIERQHGPHFIWYMLVSAHGPWNLQPTYIDDWSKIGTGRIYNDLRPVRFPTSWTNLERAGRAYMRSILYDFRVLRKYIKEFVKDDTLLIIWGDHQPVAEVTKTTAEHGVVFHVVSRRKAFIDAFVRRGYTPGMTPERKPPYPGLETFFPDLVQDFSSPKKVQ